jgi:hypothetical protein
MPGATATLATLLLAAGSQKGLPAEAVIFAGCLLGLASAWWIFRRARRLAAWGREMRRQPTVPLAQVTSHTLNEVEVEVDNLGAVAAPLSGVPCVYCSYSRARQTGIGRSARWVTYDSGTVGSQFVALRDASGRGWVNLASADFSLPSDNLASPSRERWIEQRLSPGEKLYVLGLAYRGEPPTGGALPETVAPGEPVFLDAPAQPLVVRRGTATEIERGARWRSVAGQTLAAALAVWSLGILGLYLWIRMS